MNRGIDITSPGGEFDGRAEGGANATVQGVTFHPDILDKSSERSSESPREMMASFQSIRDRTQTPMYQRKTGVTVYSEVELGNSPIGGQDIPGFRSHNALSAMSRVSDDLFEETIVLVKTPPESSLSSEDEDSSLSARIEFTEEHINKKMIEYAKRHMPSSSSSEDEVKQKQDDGESSEDETQFKILYGRVHPVRPAGLQAAPAAVKGVIPAPDGAVAATPASVDDNPTTQTVADEAAKEKKQPKGGMAWEVEAEELCSRSRSSSRVGSARIRSASHSGEIRRLSLVERLPTRLASIQAPTSNRAPLPAIGDQVSIEAFVRQQEEAEERRQEARDRRRSLSRLNRKRSKQAEERRENQFIERQRGLSRKRYVDDVKCKISDDNKLKSRKKRELERAIQAEKAYDNRAEKEADHISRSLSRNTVKQIDAERRREAIKEERTNQSRNASQCCSASKANSHLTIESRGRPLSRVGGGAASRAGARGKKDDLPPAFRGKSRLATSPAPEPDCPWGDSDRNTSYPVSPPLENPNPRIVFVKPADPTKSNLKKKSRRVNTPTWSNTDDGSDDFARLSPGKVRITRGNWNKPDTVNDAMYNTIKFNNRNTQESGHSVHWSEPAVMTQGCQGPDPNQNYTRSQNLRRQLNTQPIETWKNLPNHPAPQRGEKRAINEFFNGISPRDLHDEIDEDVSEAASLVSEEDIILPPTPPGCRSHRNETPEPTLTPALLERHQMMQQQNKVARKLERPKAAKPRRPSLFVKHLRPDPVTGIPPRKAGNKMVDTKDVPSIDGSKTNPPTPIPDEDNTGGSSLGSKITKLIGQKTKRSKKNSHRQEEEDEYERQYRDYQLSAEREAREQTEKEREKLRKQKKKSKVIIVNEASRDAQVDNVIVKTLTKSRRMIESDFGSYVAQRDECMKETDDMCVIGQTYYPTSPVMACDQTSPLKKKEKKGKKTKTQLMSRSGKTGQLSTDVNSNTVITDLEEKTATAASNAALNADEANKPHKEKQHGRWCRLKHFVARKLNPANWFRKNGRNQKPTGTDDCAAEPEMYCVSVSPGVYEATGDMQ